MLTKKQRYRLAKEARVLAMECVEGTAPEFGQHAGFLIDGPNCVLGHLYHRTFGQQAEDIYNDSGCSQEDKLVFTANDEAATPVERHAALVFPLLSLADALEGSP